MSRMQVHSRPRVLVVDDEAAVSTTLTWVFGQNGYDTVVARSGKEALTLCANPAPELALIEVALPDGSGVETARQLHRLAPGCHLFFMSGDPEAGTAVRRAQAAGLHCELLPKPIPVPELLQKLKDALAQAV